MPKQNLSARNLEALLHCNPETQRLIRHTVTLRRIQTLLENHLPPELAEHCQVAAFSGGVLTLYTPSPAWAAKLRFQTAELLRILRDPAISGATFGSLDTIRIKARPPTATPAPAATRPAESLSTATCVMLRRIADDIEDPELRRSLLRLTEN